MKILMITDRAFEQGGVSTYILSIKKLLENKHTVRVLTSNENSDKERFSDYEYRGFYNTPLPIQMVYRVFNPFSAIKLKELLKTYRPDIVHLHFIFGNTSSSILPVLKKIPTIMTVHCHTLICPNDLNFNPALCKHKSGSYCRKCTGTMRYFYNRIKYFMLKKQLSNIDLFLANSKLIENDIREANVHPTRTVYLGVNLLNYSRIDEGNNLLYIGRMEKEKGVEYLLRAMPDIINKFPNVHLDLIGDGSVKEAFKLLVNELGIERNITFVGWVPNNRIEKYYKKSTIVVVPSVLSEAFGLVGPEAMSVGRAVVASRIGGIPEWLADGRTGFLVEPGNSEQIAEKVIKLLSNRKLLEQMGMNARKKAEQFSIEKHVIKIEKIYKELIEKYKSKEVS